VLTKASRRQGAKKMRGTERQLAPDPVTVHPRLSSTSLLLHRLIFISTTLLCRSVSASVSYALPHVVFSHILHCWSPLFPSLQHAASSSSPLSPLVRGFICRHTRSFPSSSSTAHDDRTISRICAVHSRLSHCFSSIHFAVPRRLSFCSVLLLIFVDLL
jgi:hypothetical protein